ncbi:hypothetical protein Bca52824_028223 [Brassica carinata]|uniref:Uncharacterized protein n=1 Tax=Brassica carinata TaxID=52824 RepID=A0A8X7VC86_BRACI|nr:hypothetical protein Bca52824_028223 [Brassica carinata]
MSSGRCHQTAPAHVDITNSLCVARSGYKDVSSLQRPAALNSQPLLRSQPSPSQSRPSYVSLEHLQASAIVELHFRSQAKPVSSTVVLRILVGRVVHRDRDEIELVLSNNGDLFGCKRSSKVRDQGGGGRVRIRGRRENKGEEGRFGGSTMETGMVTSDKGGGSTFNTADGREGIEERAARGMLSLENLPVFGEEEEKGGYWVRGKVESGSGGSGGTGEQGRGVSPAERG